MAGNLAPDDGVSPGPGRHAVHGSPDHALVPVLVETAMLLGAQPALLRGDAEPGDRERRSVAQPVLRPIGTVRGRALLAADLRRLGLARRPHVPRRARREAGQ